MSLQSHTFAVAVLQRLHFLLIASFKKIIIKVHFIPVINRKVSVLLTLLGKLEFGW